MQIKKYFKILNDFSWIFLYLFIKACRIIFKRMSYSPSDHSGWESYDFSSLNYLEPLESEHVFWLCHSGPPNDFSKFFKLFCKGSWNSLFYTKWVRSDFSKFNTPCSSYALLAAKLIQIWKFILLENDFLGYGEYF